MPTYKITDSQTGRALKVTGSSPPTEQEALEIFSKFQEPKRFASTQVPTREELLSKLAGDVGPIEAGVIAAGRGLTTIGRGLGLASPETGLERAAFEALEERRPVATTVGEIAGEAAPFLLPAGVAAKAVTIPARVAGAAGVGTVEGGLIARGKTQDDVSTLKGAGLGGVIAGGAEVALPFVGRAVGKTFRKLTNRQPKAPLLTKGGQPTAELTAALEKAGMTFDDFSADVQSQLRAGDVSDPAALARREFLESQGLTPTKAQVTQEATQFQTQQELSKVSGPVRRRLEGQAERLKSNFENAISATGGSSVNPTNPVIDFIADRSIDLDAAISSAYKAAREAAPVDKVIKPSNLTEEIRKIAGSDRATGGLPSAARDILRARGVLPQKGLEVQGRVSAEIAEEVRKDLNGLFDSLTPFGRKKLSGLKNALDSDVSAAIGADIFADARKAKSSFESELARAKVNKFDARKKNLVRDILENKVNPDRFLDDAVLSKTTRAADLNQLKNYLKIDDNGVAAWNDLRAEAMQRIGNEAFPEVGGVAALSRAKLEKSLDRIGKDKLRVLFSAEENKFLDDLVKTAKILEPARGTALGRGPSSQAVQKLENTIKRIPLLNVALSPTFEGVGRVLAGQKATSVPTLRRSLQALPRQVTSAIPAATAASLQAQEQEDR